MKDNNHELIVDYNYLHSGKRQKVINKSFCKKRHYKTFQLTCNSSSALTRQ